MIRLLQAASNPTLIYEKSDEFDVTNEEFGVPKQKVSLTSIKREAPDTYEKIMHYSEKEIPSKLVEATKLTKELLAKGEKVIIWSSFVTNMLLFENQLLKDEKPILIYGDISREEEDDDNRDKRIQEFKDDPNPRVLIATPASLAESVSLHINSKTDEKVCSHAIYLDRNFNGAQFMQSMDRIHRLGMDKKTQVVYHLIIGKKTIDEKIDDRLWQKFSDMSFALNDSWPAVLDYDGTREEIGKEEAQKDFNSLVEHLKELKKDLEKENGN
jgi:SNF2 family DNA or RNA helicase